MWLLMVTASCAVLICALCVCSSKLLWTRFSGRTNKSKTPIARPGLRGKATGASISLEHVSGEFPNGAKLHGYLQENDPEVLDLRELSMVSNQRLRDLIYFSAPMETVRSVILQSDEVGPIGIMAFLGGRFPALRTITLITSREDAGSIGRALVDYLTKPEHPISLNYQTLVEHCR